MEIKLEVSQFFEDEQVYKPAIVTLRNAEVRAEPISHGRDDSLEVWITGNCARCGKKLSFYFLFPGETVLHSEVADEECDCGVYTGQGYVVRSSVSTLERMLREEGIGWEIEVEDIGTYYRYFPRRRRRR